MGNWGGEDGTPDIRKWAKKTWGRGQEEKEKIWNAPDMKKCGKTRGQGKGKINKNMVKVK